jgi:hypothetical protein
LTNNYEIKTIGHVSIFINRHERMLATELEQANELPFAHDRHDHP